MMTYTSIFVLSGLLIVIAGSALAKYADDISDITGMGRLWTGSILLAAATSLPELATDVAAVRMGAPDLAAGDLFGSSMANMLILAIVDLIYSRQHLLQKAALDHALAASLAITLNAIGAIFMLLHEKLTVFGASPVSWIILVLYVAGTRVLYQHNRTENSAPPTSPSPPQEVPPKGKLSVALAKFFAAALGVLLAAPGFAWAAKGIAERTGLGSTFVGTWLVGLSTSLPELVSTIAAVRMGAFDLAVGNLFGSNAFNMVVFLPMDLAQPGSAISSSLAPAHALSGLIAIILMGIGLSAIVYRAKRRMALIEPSSLMLVLAYVIGIILLKQYS